MVKNYTDWVFENFSQSYKEAKTNQYVYHASAPVFRDKIAKEGLLPQRGEQWLSDTAVEGKAIFATNSDDKKDWFDSGYDDDVYQIDTTKIDNKWYSDPNFAHSDHKHIFTFKEIPLSAIKLFHKGTGEELI